MIPHNPTTGNAYTGGNVNRLIGRSESAQFAGFHQWLTAGRAVRKGEKAVAHIVMILTKKKPDGSTVKVPRTAAVFSFEQTEALQ